MNYLLLKLFNKVVCSIYSFLHLFHHKSIKVIMLHEIVDDNITPKELQLSYSDFKSFVKKMNNYCSGISIQKFYDSFSKQEFNKEYVVTFDDVFESVYQYAFPLLVANNIPFILFVNISLLDKPNYLTTHQLIEMAHNELCTIGSHGMNHLYYRKLTNEDVAKELHNSKVVLEKLLNKPINFFAFPYGSLVAVSFRNIKETKRSKYRMSFSTIPSGVWNSVLIDKHFIPRINITKKMIKKL